VPTGKPTRTKGAHRRERRSREASHSEPRLPYTTTPGALRKFLQEVPKKPKPGRVNNALLGSWQLGGSNANWIIRVLKALDLVNASNEPTEYYEAFMREGTGPTPSSKSIGRLNEGESRVGAGGPLSRLAAQNSHPILPGSAHVLHRLGSTLPPPRRV